VGNKEPKALKVNAEIKAIMATKATMAKMGMME